MLGSLRAPRGVSDKFLGNYTRASELGGQITDEDEKVSRSLKDPATHTPFPNASAGLSLSVSLTLSLSLSLSLSLCLPLQVPARGEGAATDAGVPHS